MDLIVDGLHVDRAGGIQLGQLAVADTQQCRRVHLQLLADERRQRLAIRALQALAHENNYQPKPNPTTLLDCPLSDF